MFYCLTASCLEMKMICFHHVNLGPKAELNNTLLVAPGVVRPGAGTCDGTTKGCRFCERQLGFGKRANALLAFSTPLPSSLLELNFCGQAAVLSISKTDAHTHTHIHMLTHSTEMKGLRIDYDKSKLIWTHTSHQTELSDSVKIEKICNEPSGVSLRWNIQKGLWSIPCIATSLYKLTTIGTYLLEVFIQVKSLNLLLVIAYSSLGDTISCEAEGGVSKCQGDMSRYNWGSFIMSKALNVR